MKKGDIICIIGMLVMLSPILVMIIGSQEIVVGEKLCVDGNNNINLEGMMCEDTDFTFFGYAQWLIIIPALILLPIGMFIFNIGFNLDAKKVKAE